MVRNFQASQQWERIQKYWITENAADDLTNFKSDQRNHKIALWDPRDNGIRYLKTLVYNLALGLDKEDWVRLKEVKNRNIGNPLTVRCHGETVCLDYLQAVLELGFIDQEVDLQGASVMEIGAGYGRTCHTILSNHDITGYTIVDLDNTMRLSRKYLSEVLDGKQFAKITFIEAGNADSALESMWFDLCINIHSMAEMTPETVQDYLGLIGRTCASFYVKNPVGKHTDKSMDGHPEGTEAIQMAMETGPLRQVLDIHDTVAVNAAVPDFIAAYRPGENWTCAANGRAIPWSYFWQAIYKNDA